MLVAIIVAFVSGIAVRGLVGPRDAVTALIDRYVIGVALPALIVSKMSRAHLGQETVVPVAMAWMVMGLSVAVVLVTARWRRWPAPVTGAVLMVGVLGNTSFLGLGVVGTLLGTDHLPAAISYDQLGSFLGLATYGAVVAGRFGNGAPGWRPVAGRVFRFIPFLALLISPVIALCEPTDLLYRVLDVPGATVGIAAMFSLGWRLSPGVWNESPDAVLTALVVKMIVAPLIVVLIGLALGGVDTVAWRASVLQSGAPPMVTAGLVAVSAGLDPKVVASAVGMGTIASVVLLPAWWLVVG